MVAKSGEIDLHSYKHCDHPDSMQGSSSSSSSLAYTTVHSTSNFD
jgi:hypothetical protein